VALTEEQRAFLEAPRFAVAATISADGLPHQTVVWYALDGDEEMVSARRAGASSIETCCATPGSLCAWRTASAM
jgi:predicted pyridoxine 5'-phosphate oxidase superfamily flavin-nucleotide-binding protein